MGQKVEIPAFSSIVCTALDINFRTNPGMTALLEGEFELAKACYDLGKYTLSPIEYKAVVVTTNLIQNSFGREGGATIEEGEAFRNYRQSVQLENDTRHPRRGL